ncbi:hypothetical protein [Streptomyces chattanoogensis]|uniref:hypothetical protein n=1 Tax=Streptomyces chattanoogensis TaxID=66876 RepID=UPI0012FF37AD|nr:hypothetical protein [Streptomyces chattanoogensis]
MINTANSSIRYHGKIAEYGTYSRLHAEMAEDIDDVIFDGGPLRVFKGDRLVIIDCTQGNKVIYDGRILAHGGYTSLPATWVS